MNGDARDDHLLSPPLSSKGGEGEGAARVRWRQAALFRALILLTSAATLSLALGVRSEGDR